MAIRILVCDDHPEFRAGLAAALADEPDIVLAAPAGTLGELRRAVEQIEVDLILLDLGLRDGPATDAVAELATTAPVVVISANDEPDLVRRALREGALGYMPKSVEPAEMLRLVRRAADGKTAICGDMALRLAESLRRQRDGGVVDAGALRDESAHVDRRVRGRQVHPGLQLADDAGHVVEPGLHGRRVLGQHAARHLGVAGVHHLAHPPEGHVERPQPLDHRGVGELRGVIAAVARGGVDPCGHQDACLVVCAQRLDRQQAGPREGADRHQAVCHDGHPAASPWGRVNARQRGARRDHEAEHGPSAGLERAAS
jgi:DNA-binding NarL/FixJ family response regulator